MDIRKDVLITGAYYHIFNRRINGCKIFVTAENYKFFLTKFTKYVGNYVDVFCYCLMPNHFHFVVKIKSQIELEKIVNVQNFDKGTNTGLHALRSIVSKQIGKFISSYSQAFNKVNNRHGALVESPFKRKRIETDEYLRNIILYIHSNPQDIWINFETYKFSSYQACTSKLKTNVCRDEVLSIFGDVENFIHTHKYPPKFDCGFN